MPDLGMSSSSERPASNFDRRESARKLSARCVLFDLDGTLYNSPAYSERLEEEISKVVSEELSLSESHAKLLLERKRKEIGTLTRAIESLGIDRKLFYHKIAGRIEPYMYIASNARVRQTIAELKKMGFRTGLVSNLQPPHDPRKQLVLE